MKFHHIEEVSAIHKNKEDVSGLDSGDPIPGDAAFRKTAATLRDNILRVERVLHGSRVGSEPMPVHDWTRVDAGIFHDFHQNWVMEIKLALNRGLLPRDYYALTEQRSTAGFERERLDTEVAVSRRA